VRGHLCSGGFCSEDPALPRVCLQAPRGVVVKQAR
jgi:hypothetical protein